jgi:hypothetical protein
MASAQALASASSGRIAISADVSRSSRQSVFIIEVSMVGGSKRLLEVRCTVFANFQKTIRGAANALRTYLLP